jgi:hypothetical protein
MLGSHACEASFHLVWRNPPGEVSVMGFLHVCQQFFVAILHASRFHNARHIRGETFKANFVIFIVN